MRTPLWFRIWRERRWYRRRVAEQALWYMEQCGMREDLAFDRAAMRVSAQSDQRARALVIRSNLPAQRYTDQQLDAALRCVRDSSLLDALHDLKALRETVQRWADPRPAA